MLDGALTAIFKYGSPESSAISAPVSPTGALIELPPFHAEYEGERPASIIAPPVMNRRSGRITGRCAIDLIFPHFGGTAMDVLRHRQGEYDIHDERDDFSYFPEFFCRF